MLGEEGWSLMLAGGGTCLSVRDYTHFWHLVTVLCGKDWSLGNGKPRMGRATPWQGLTRMQIPCFLLQLKSSFWTQKMVLGGGATGLLCPSFQFGHNESCFLLVYCFLSCFFFFSIICYFIVLIEGMAKSACQRAQPWPWLLPQHHTGESHRGLEGRGMWHQAVLDDIQSHAHILLSASSTES